MSTAETQRTQRKNAQTLRSLRLCGEFWVITNISNLDKSSNLADNFLVINLKEGKVVSETHVAKNAGNQSEGNRPVTEVHHEEDG